MKRHNLILAVVLLLQVTLSVVVFWPRSAATGGGEPLFPDLDPGDIVALTIADDQGNSITLRKVDEAWVVSDADDYPAKADSITPALEKIVLLDTGRLVTRTDASHKRLQVADDDFLRRIEFETADGNSHVFFLGSSPSYGAAHFRLDGQNETYLTSELSAPDVGATASSWTDTTYFVLDQNDLAQVTLENAHGTFTFINEATGEEENPRWTLVGLEEGEELAAGTVSTAIGKGTWVTMVEPLGTTEEGVYGMDEPAATVTIEKRDGQVVTLHVGAQDPDDSSYVVKVSESPYYVRVSEYNAQPLVEDTRDDFIQPPPTPEASPTPAG